MTAPDHHGGRVLETWGARAGFGDRAADENGAAHHSVRGPGVETWRQAQLDPTALSVLAMLLPAD
ncbi:hypothetical protein, partial [Mycobacterium intracellulare]|uniref:hypothetical protein n=1 Tax=Mycobacterium intracellulare TaxID=1767 RepID=UPI001C614F26